MPIKLTLENTWRLVLIIAMGLSMDACRKTPNDHPTPTLTTVYVLGSVANSPVYWKNGTQTTLVIPSGATASGTSMSVSDTNVYVAVNINATPGVNGSPEYWKNGVSTPLQDSGRTGYVSSIFVSGNDVYVAGVANYPYTTHGVPYTTPTAVYPKIGQVATYWKNGVAMSLPGIGLVGLDSGYATTSYLDYVNSVFVSGNDVYMAGGSNQWQLGNPSSYQFAKYWQNGTPVDLTNGLLDSATFPGNTYPTMISYPATTSIYVSGTDVYVSGYENSNSGTQALYWKNGSPSYLQSSASISKASNIFVSGNDIYAVGYQWDGSIYYATCWKNGVADTLSSSTSGSRANAVFVSGTDVYVAGYEIVSGVTYVTYWKNGLPVHLAPGGTASAIYVE